MQENENVNAQEQVAPEMQQPTGWKDIRLSEQMPLAALVEFLNILNQRLCTIEDNTYITGPNGKHMSITEFYELQAVEEAKAQAQKAQEQKKEDK